MWRIVKVGEEDKTCGLLCTYVDDFLLMAEAGEMTKALIKHLKSVWRDVRVQRCRIRRNWNKVANWLPNCMGRFNYFVEKRTSDNTSIEHM